MDNLLETLNARIEQLLAALREKDAAIATLNEELHAARQQCEQQTQSTEDLNSRLDAQNAQLTELLTRVDGALTANADQSDNADKAAQGDKAQQKEDFLDVDLG